MISRSLKWVADHVGGYLAHAPEDLNIEGVSIDTRTLQNGNLYVPLIGARSDGHNYVEQIKDKVPAVLWQYDHRPYPDDVGLIIVKDTQQALQQLAKAYAAELDALFIGVTGSNGKTSTKDYLAGLLSLLAKTQKTQGNHNNEIGLPLTLLDLDEDTRFAIVEMGMEKSGEIAFLCELVDLDGAIITSIGQAHLENFASKKGIAQAKYEITSRLNENGWLLFDADSPELREVIEEADPAPFYMVGFSTESPDIVETRKYPIFPIEVVQEGDHSILKLGSRHVELDAIGFQALDAAIASLAAIILGLDASLLKMGLDEARLSAHRGQTFMADQALIIDDSYKSNPESAKNALQLLKKSASGKSIAVLSDMLDLGETSQELHRQVGEYARAIGIDEIATWGESARAISEGGGIHFESKPELIAWLKEEIKNPVTVLVKGSRAMKMEEVLEALKEEKDD